MKRTLSLVLLLLLPLVGRAQSLTLLWHRIAAGGGTSTNASYSLSGTIGQPEASGALTNGVFLVRGGFWSFIRVLQTVGLPDLAITHTGSTVTVSWPATGTYTLQQSADLALPNGWATSGYPIVTADGTNSLTMTPTAAGTLFFRLKQ